MRAELNLAAADLGAESGRVIYGHFANDRLSIEEVHRFRNQSVFLNKYLYWDFLNLFHNIQRVCASLLSRPNLWELPGYLGSITTSDSSALAGKPVSYRDHRTDNALPAVLIGG